MKALTEARERLEQASAAVALAVDEGNHRPAQALSLRAVRWHIREALAELAGYHDLLSARGDGEGR